MAGGGVDAIDFQRQLDAALRECSASPAFLAGVATQPPSLFIVHRATSTHGTALEHQPHRLSHEPALGVPAA